MTNVITRPARLDIKDLPRDPDRALGSLRQTLCASYNYCTRYPAKLELLKNTLKVAYNRINALQKEQEAAVEAQKKADTLAAAAAKTAAAEQEKALEAEKQLAKIDELEAAKVRVAELTKELKDVVAPATQASTKE